MLALVLDIETTGLEYVDEIIQFGYVLANEDTIVEHGLINYKSTVDYTEKNTKKRKDYTGSISVHGLSKRKMDATSRGTFKELAHELIPLFQRADLIVCHNVGFDLNMIIEQQVPDLGSLVNNKPFKCTMSGYGNKSRKFLCNSQKGIYTTYMKLSQLLYKYVNSGHLSLYDLRLDFMGLTGMDCNFHNALWDAYITFRCYRVLESDTSC